jgi:phosphoribosylaminoimidazolecarboxamide formyltransferase/IMP cyclohydrolase
MATLMKCLKLHGKELSYNNLLDVDAAVNLMSEFVGIYHVCRFKHNNACGVAQEIQFIRLM